jgi:hypothetical protein
MKDRTKKDKSKKARTTTMKTKREKEKFRGIRDKMNKSEVESVGVTDEVVVIR